MRIRAITVAIFVLVVPFVIAQTETITKQAEHEKEITPKQKAAKKRLDYMFESCAGFLGERTSDGAKIEILPKPLLRWTNPDFGVRDGLFVAWVDQKNRPMAAGQVFLMPNTQNDWYIEQQSLWDGPMQFTSKTNPSWRPRAPGIQWNKFSTKILQPAKSKPLRLGQMRKLARRFRGEDDLTATVSVLRLMPNPMVRYADEENGVIDGALFALVQGTDPELLIQIEAREDERQNHEYWWALAPMTSANLEGYLDGNRVWSKPRASGSPSAIFYMRQLAGGVPFPAE